MKQNSARVRHTSGSPVAWKLRREAYRTRSSPVSNPGDGRVHAEGRRAYKRIQLRTYLLDWDEALSLNAIPQEPK